MPMSGDNKRKHLKFIQAAISRMAGNLFFLRGWTITLLTGIFAIVVSKEVNTRYFLLAYFLLFIFWILDGYFLSQERKFRCLYDDVRKLDEAEIDFCMRTHKYSKFWRNKWLGAILSSTLLWFYVPVALAMLLVLSLIHK